MCVCVCVSNQLCMPCLHPNVSVSVSAPVECMCVHVSVCVRVCVYFLYSPRQSFIDLGGPVGTVLTANRDTRRPQPLARRSLHIIPKHMTTAALSQHRGKAVVRQRGEEEEDNGKGRDFVAELVNA